MTRRVERPTAGRLNISDKPTADPCNITLPNYFSGK